MLGERREQLVLALRKTQEELKGLGFTALISHTVLPQGDSISLVVGESEQSIVATYTVLSIGEEFAQTADASRRQRFAQELADNIADRATTSAAARSDRPGFERGVGTTEHL